MTEQPYDLPGLEPEPEPVREEPSAAAAPPEPDSAPDTPRPPEPLGVVVAPTGNAEVDAAVERLGDAGLLPTEGHIEVYEDVHQGLREALAALDENRG
jgi:hypothetical protein